MQEIGLNYNFLILFKTMLISFPFLERLDFSLGKTLDILRNGIPVFKK